MQLRWIRRLGSILLVICLLAALLQLFMWRTNTAIVRRVPRVPRAKCVQLFMGEYLRPAFGHVLFSKQTPFCPYRNRNKPAFFYGVIHDLKVLSEHQSLGVVILTGGDGNPETPAGKVALEILRTHWNLRAVSISSFIEESLQISKVTQFVRSPFFPLQVDDFAPVKRGQSVYVYGDDDAVYHNNLVREKVEPHFPDIQFIYAAHWAQGMPRLQPPWRHFGHDELRKKIYHQIFISIRLTHHDGLSATVQELGCMGIRTVWNGGTPSAIAWNTVADVIEAIERERKTIGTVDRELSEKVKHFLRVNATFYDFATHFPELFSG